MFFPELSQQKTARKTVERENENLQAKTKKYNFVNFLLEDAIGFNVQIMDCINETECESKSYPWIDSEVEIKQGHIQDLEPQGTRRLHKDDLDKENALDTNVIVFEHSHILLKDIRSDGNSGWQRFEDGNSPFGLLPQFQMNGESSYIIGHAKMKTYFKSCARWVYQISEIFDVRNNEWIKFSEIAKTTAFENIRKHMENPFFEYMAVEVQLVNFGFHYTIDGKELTKENVESNELDKDGNAIKRKRILLRGKL